MPKLAPFVLGSVAAHVALLALLAGSASTAASDGRVVEVSALVQRHSPEPAVAPEEEPPPERERPEPGRRQRPARRPSPLPTEPSPEEVEPLELPSPTPAAGGEVAEAQEDSLQPQPAPAAAPAAGPALAAAPDGLAAGAQGSPRAGEGGGSRGEPASPRRRRRAGVGAVDCPDSFAALHRRFRAAGFPQWARELGLSGTVRLRLQVGRSGNPRGVRVLGSSGNADLDRFAVSAARSFRGIPPCASPIDMPVIYSPPPRR